MNTTNNKIGIITFHNAINYGAVLQTYALFTAFSKLCDTVEVIDYKSDVIENRYKLKIPSSFSFSSLKQLLRFFLGYNRIRSKRSAFNQFFHKNNVRFSNSFTTRDTSTFRWKAFSKIVVGSDQIWNCDITKCDPVFTLAMGGLSCQKYSYAASLGKAELTKDEISFFDKCLKSFKAISVREEGSQRTLNSKIGINCLVHMDPVFLLLKSDWEKLANFQSKDVYVFVYLLKKSDKLIEKAKILAQKEGLKLIEIKTGMLRRKGFSYPDNESIEAFLGLFSKAKYVITNSFHGICFSILLNKTFFYELQSAGSNTNLRIKNIISLFNLENCDVNSCASDEAIDFVSINNIIEKERERSLAYIREIALS